MNTIELIWCGAITIALLIVIYKITQFQRMNSHLIAMAKNYAALMGQKSGEARGLAQRERIKEEAKGQLVEALAEEIPWGQKIIENLRARGMTDGQLFAMITDPDVLKGVNVLSDMGRGIMKGAGDLLGKEKPKDDYTAEYLKTLKGRA